MNRFALCGNGCLHCSNLLKMGKQTGNEGWTCKAFPKGIPLGIRSGIDRHDEPYPYDNDIQYHWPAKAIQDDDGKPCFHFVDWYGMPHVVETKAEIPDYAEM
jgi:hypothetical protein